MATQTTNYNLSKPDAGDQFSAFRQSYNDNMDIIDANLGGGGGDSVSWNQIQQTGTKITTNERASFLIPLFVLVILFNYMCLSVNHNFGQIFIAEI